MQFIGGVAQPVAGPSPGDQPLREMHRAMIDRLPLCKENTEACVLDKRRHATVKGW